MGFSKAAREGPVGLFADTEGLPDCREERPEVAGTLSGHEGMDGDVVSTQVSRTTDRMRV